MSYYIETNYNRYKRVEVKTLRRMAYIRRGEYTKPPFAYSLACDDGGKHGPAGVREGS